MNTIASRDEQPWKNPKTPSRRGGARTQAWANFNERTAELVAAAGVVRDAACSGADQDRALKKAFGTYLSAVSQDVTRLARVCVRKKHPAKWIELEDVEAEVRFLLWHYLFVRADGAGVVGFDASKCNSPGAWVKWKVTHHLMKTLSKQRGECQHCRGVGYVRKKGEKVSCQCSPGGGAAARNAAPEYLSKTGELPEQGRESQTIAHVEARREIGKLEALCKTAREFAILQALAQGLGDERRVVACLIEKKVYEDPAVALREVDDFVEALAKKKGAQVARQKLAA